MLIARFLQDQRASLVPTFALAATAIIGFVGAAVDYSRASSARTAMQAALDAAALNLSKQAEQLSNEQLGDNATAHFNANFTHSGVEGIGVTAAPSLVAGGRSLALSASGMIKTQLMRLVGIPTLAIRVNSAVVTMNDGLGCVLSLDPSAPAAGAAKGSAAVNLNGCSLYDNSANPTALTVDGSAKISAWSVGVVGGISGQESIAATQGVRTRIAPVPDPYASASFPSFSGCSEKNFNATKTITINPGVYCGGIAIHGNANVTLNPGIYYLDGGSLTVNGGATLTGTGVTLVFTKKNENGWATAAISGGATVNLTPPISGPTAGIVIFGDRGMPTDTTFKFTGGASQYLAGAVYLPSGAIDFSGGAGANTSCTKIIGSTVTFSGKSTLAIDCSSYKTKEFGLTVVRLVT
jgi:Putative Flp pilus-assembly TadE/G-like